MFESILAAAQYTSRATSRIHDRVKAGKPGWRYVTI